jgi:beta-galactosidase
MTRLVERAVQAPDGHYGFLEDDPMFRLVRGFGLFVVFLCTCVLAFCLPAFSASLGDVSPRLEQNFSTRWLYTPKDVTGGESPTLQDAGFDHVSVPHANIITPGEIFDADIFRFVSWYRKHFRPDPSWKGKLVTARFQGVMTVADVYLNGKHLAQHKGGYTSFDVDLTPVLRFGADNVIAVRVDSRAHKDIPPEGAPRFFGFYSFGGIQRDVEMIVRDKLHIERVYYVTSRLQPDAAVSAAITVRNDRQAATQAAVRVRILDDQGKEVASATSKVNLNAREAQDAHVEVSPIADPKLWDPDHPNRYIVVAEVADESGTTDRDATWIGLRQFDWNDNGLLINGHPLKIRGMNRHQTQPFIGGAVPNRLQRRDALILKYGLGLNMVRSSHYPPDPEFLDECDRIGLLVMDEFPVFQFVGTDPEWQQTAVDMARDMILRDRNHPSIILWGVHGNEASLKEGDDRDFYARTYGLVHDLDPTRRPAGARETIAWHGKLVPEEVLTVNDYSPLDKFPMPVATHPWLITEYGDGEQFPVWAWEPNLLRFALRWARQMNSIYAQSDIAGGVGWAAFDYFDPEFNFPWAVVAYHNVDDVYRLPKGFAGYVLESQKDPDLYGATVHILSYWTSWWRGGGPDLWVASNADEVEIRINGKSIGRQQPSEYTSLPHPLFKFPLGDAFQAGTVEAIAYRHGEAVAKEQMRTPEADSQSLQVVADDSAIIGDGADLTRVVVYAVDANGTIAPYEDRRVNIEVKNGRLLGMSPVHLEGGRIAFYVQAREGEAGPIMVRVHADGLTPAEARIEVQPVVDTALPFGPFDLKRDADLKFKASRR